MHLKLRALAWAAEHGIDEVYTWTQDGNAAMRALNTRLGYATTRTGVQLSRPLSVDGSSTPDNGDGDRVLRISPR